MTSTAPAAGEAIPAVELPWGLTQKTVLAILLGGVGLLIYGILAKGGIWRRSRPSFWPSAFSRGLPGRVL